MLFRSEIRTLDSFGFASVGLIKIDAEGHEEAVLKGAADTLSRWRPSLIVEIEERHNPGGLARIRALFGGMGYVAAALDGGGASQAGIHRGGRTSRACFSGRHQQFRSDGCRKGQTSVRDRITVSLIDLEARGLHDWLPARELLDHHMLRGFGSGIDERLEA